MSDKQYDLSPIVLMFLAALGEVELVDIHVDEQGRKIVDVFVGRYGDEIFTFEDDDGSKYIWSISKATEIIQRDEVLAAMIDTHPAVGMIQRGQIQLELEKLKQTTPASLARPLILVPKHDGTCYMIDGWHRVAFAAANFVFELPAYLLDREQELECRIYGLGIDRRVAPQTKGGNDD